MSKGSPSEMFSTQWLAERGLWTRFLVVLVVMFLVTKAVGFVLFGEPPLSHIAQTLLGSLLVSWFAAPRLGARPRTPG